jgi:branched-subunit amino acid ABC-type transport system permease component
MLSVLELERPVSGQQEVSSSLSCPLVGGLIIGVAESIGPELITNIFHGIGLDLDFPHTMKQVVSFFILIVIMLLRPQGLFGGKKG